MIKLVDILKEIQTQPKKIIGYGNQGNVYNVGKDKIVKKSTNPKGFSQDEIKTYNLFNQYPDVFPHIYKLTKDYVIMDKLDQKPLGDVYNFLETTDIWREEDYLINIYQMVSNNDSNDLEIFNKILQKAKELNRIDVYNTLKKCLDFCIELKKIFKSKPVDVWLPNVGVDNNGKIKIFDTSFDRMG